MRVCDLMATEVITLEVEDTLDLADDLMRLGRIRHMPIVDREGRLVGLVSQRDLFRAAISSVLRFRAQAEREWLAGISVRSVMTTNVFSVTPDTSVRSAVELMLAKRIGCLPIVENGRVIGLLSEQDCLQYLDRLLTIAEAKAALPEHADAG